MGFLDTDTELSLLPRSQALTALVHAGRYAGLAVGAQQLDYSDVGRKPAPAVSSKGMPPALDMGNSRRSVEIQCSILISGIF
jgi:hypothetical protein